jgi:hypothetical protein
MGTSSAAPAPRKKGWKVVASELGNKNSNVFNLVNIAASTVLPQLPPLQMASIVLLGIKSGINFIENVEKNGLNETIKKESLKVSMSFVASSISNSLWELTSSKLEMGDKNTPISRIAEIAFKKTTAGIISRGAEELFNGE